MDIGQSEEPASSSKDIVDEVIVENESSEMMDSTAPTVDDSITATTSIHQKNIVTEVEMNTAEADVQADSEQAHADMTDMTTEMGDTIDNQQAADLQADSLMGEDNPRVSRVHYQIRCHGNVHRPNTE
jgi:hydroxylamine reductase (hybrid-cluster protein)